MSTITNNAQHELVDRGAPAPANPPLVGRAMRVDNKPDAMESMMKARLAEKQTRIGLPVVMPQAVH